MRQSAKDLKGMKQNYLTAIEYVGSNGKKSGIGETTLLYRLDHGWTEDILFTKPDLSNKSTTLKMQAQTTASQLKPKQDQ